jgi:hypothetical protein
VLETSPVTSACTLVSVHTSAWDAVSVSSVWMQGRGIGLLVQRAQIPTRDCPKQSNIPQLPQFLFSILYYLLSYAFCVSPESPTSSNSCFTYPTNAPHISYAHTPLALCVLHGSFQSVITHSFIRKRYFLALFPLSQLYQTIKAALCTGSSILFGSRPSIPAPPPYLSLFVFLVGLYLFYSHISPQTMRSCT